MNSVCPGSGSCVERSGKEFKAHVYKKRERERRQREIELGYMMRIRLRRY